MSGLHNGSGWGSVSFWPKHKSHESALSLVHLSGLYYINIILSVSIFYTFNILSILQVHNQYIKHISFSQARTQETVQNCFKCIKILKCVVQFLN